MKLKEKIIGSVAILILSLVFLVSGYIINKKDENVYKKLNSDKAEAMIFNQNNNNNNNEYGNSNKTKAYDYNVSNKQESTKTIIVDIKGAVKNPKEYELPEGSRVRDLVNAAGGLDKDADENTVHFSKILRDEECIIVYKIGEQQNSGTTEIETNPISSNNNIKININIATIEQLSTLYGIGEVKAKAIIEYREKNGGFKSIEELGNVDGIGSKTIDKLRDKVDIK